MSEANNMIKEAMKLALEALEDIKDDCSGCEFEWSNDYPLQAKAKLALEEALAKQEQGEPVALKVYHGELCYKSQADDQSFGMWCPVTQNLPFQEGTKFYTTPQQRKPLDEPLVGALLYLFQEWKEDHLSQSNYIDCVEGIKEAHGIHPSDFKE